MSRIIIPFANPLQIVPANPNTNDLYRTRHMDNYLFADQLYDFQEQIPFYQSWLAKDIIKLQFTSNYTPIQCDLTDRYGRIKTGYSANMTQVRVNKYNPDYYIYEASLALTGLSGGPFRYLFTPAGNLADQQKTEWFNVVRDNNNTILLRYFHSRYQGDVVYETGLAFTLRIPGYLEFKEPASKVVVFENQPLNQTIVSGRRYRNFDFHVGDGSGVPPWMIDKINIAFMCDTLEVDDKPFALVDGKWTGGREDNNALVGYTMSLRESLNRSSRIVDATIDPNKKITIISNIDGRLFGDVSANAGETIIRILNQG